MAAEERIIKKWCSDLKCFFVLIAHIQREKDEIQGGTKIMVDALGTKLAPKVPKDFGDVVLAVRDGTKYCWSTTALQVDLKAATLPLSDKLDPTFKHIVDAWKRRSKVVTKEEVKEEK